jgi:nitrate reductase NapE component
MAQSPQSKSLPRSAPVEPAETAKKQEISYGGILALCLIIAVGLVGVYVFRHADSNTYRVRVVALADNGKHGQHDYVIRTNRGTVPNTNNIWYLKTNSAQLFHQLRIGHTYDCNIIRATTISPLTIFGQQILPHPITIKSNLLDCNEVKRPAK